MGKYNFVLKTNQFTEEEIQEILKRIAKENNYKFPEYDGFGNVKLIARGFQFIMNAKEFHRIMANQITETREKSNDEE